MFWFPQVQSNPAIVLTPPFQPNLNTRAGGTQSTSQPAGGVTRVSHWPPRVPELDPEPLMATPSQRATSNYNLSRKTLSNKAVYRHRRRRE